MDRLTSVPFDPDRWRRTIWAITSIFESGRPSGDPAAFQNHDAGIISYGLHQATLASGSLEAVLTAFFRLSDSDGSRALENEYAARVARRDPALRDDARFRGLLLQVASETAMTAAQDAVFERDYYRPSVALSKGLGVRSPLGVAVVYDTAVQGGLTIVLARLRAHLGGLIGETDGDGRFIDEGSWIAAFLDERQRWLVELADRLALRGDEANANALRISLFRVRELRQLLRDGNLLLEGIFLVRGHAVAGIDHPDGTGEPAPTGRIRVRNKIGFHCGPGGNRQGLNRADWGGWMSNLTHARIPFFLKSTDDYGPLEEAVDHMRREGVTHTLVFRLSTAGRNDGISYDTPDYSLTPVAAAAKHWAQTRQQLPPAFDRERVWIEPVNEVDRNRADWLGHFGVALANLAQAAGYRVTLFGWASGEPEPEQWTTPGMLAYLRLCAERPEQTAVSLHEYSYVVDDIRDGFPFKIGRFRFLFEACDRHGIARPTVHITEWGWEYQRVPEPDVALDGIRWANALYGPHPQIQGAALWHLGGGAQFGSIANLTQRLIRPLTELTTQEQFDVDMLGRFWSDADESGGRSGSGAGTTRVVNNGRYVADVNFPDYAPVEAEGAIVKRWRVANNGTTVWEADWTVVYVPDAANGSVRMADRHSFTLGEIASRVPVRPGDDVELAVPMTAPAVAREKAYFSDWRLRDGDGRPFGDIFYIKINVIPVKPNRLQASDALWLADVTIPDGLELMAGQTFRKRWRVKNNGTRKWGAGYRLVHVGHNEEAMTGNLSHPLPAVDPGGEVEIALDLTAPLQSRDDSYVSMWRLHDDRDKAFGDRLWVEIKVVPGERPLPMAPLSQNDPRWKGQRFGDGTHTIGRFGCLLTTMAMIASAYGHENTPVTLNALVNRPGGASFMPGSVTPFRLLHDMYADIVYDGRFTHRREIKAGDPANIRFDPNVIGRIDAALAQGGMVVTQVDNTPATPYTHSDDQHWLVLIAREGEDYLAVDPANGRLISLLTVYGRQNHRLDGNVSLEDAILSALFYRSTRQMGGITPVDPPGTGNGTTRLSTGININPDAPHSNPFGGELLRGLDWVRFAFKVDAQVDPRRRNVSAALSYYDPFIQAYAARGIRCLLVLNQETTWGNGPWDHGDWTSYRRLLAERAGEIAAHYTHLGNKVGYEIWNEPDLAHNPSAVFVPAAEYGHLLQAVATAVRRAAPSAPLVTGGVASGPPTAIPYLQQALAAIGGRWPVEALGIHPYGRWATRAPFDWGTNFGTLGQAISAYRTAFPAMPLWITEMGVANDTPIGGEHYAAIADYIKDVYSHIGQRHATAVPVIIWFAWSDWMRNAGIVERDGRPKEHVFAAFKAVRERRLPGL